jgi:predicted HTH domain antitoxin
MSRTELRDLFKQEVVYVYHNRIDDIGDKRQSEGETVKAVRETIDELKRLIKNLHSQYNVARVLLTADHGFIYQHVAPDDLTLMKAPDVTTKLEKNRYLLTAQTNITATGSHSFPLSKASALTSQADWHVLVPEGVNRYRRQGSGTRYVHGGASLQEVLVPILESSRKREEVGQKVTVRLVREELTLLANQVKLLLLQEQRVTDVDRPRTVAIGLYVGNELASNRVELLFDSVAEGASGTYP